MLNIRDGLALDDVLLLPKYSEIKSRADVDLIVNLSKGFSFKHPITPANMKTICDRDMALVIAENTGGLAILHRFMPLKDQLKTVHYLSAYWKNIGVSIGVKEEDYKNIQELYSIGARIFCVDVANGNSLQCINMTKHIAENFPDVFLIAGNVATGDGAKRLWLAGADAVKAHIGCGSLCSTRIETGNGSPTLTTLNDIAEMKKKLTLPYKEIFRGEYAENTQLIKKPIFIIADGGCKNSGDITKSLCFADMVMTGSLFAGTDETPGEILQIDGAAYKSYVGSSTHKINHIEGVASIVKKKGSAKDIITKLCEGIRSGLSYQGVANLTDLKKDPQFIRITNAGLKESHPHIDGRIV
jgi:IMP dehydrogenase